MTRWEESSTTPVSAPRTTPGSARPSAIVVTIDGSMATRTDGPGLCERVHGLLEGSDADVAIIDVGVLTDPDVGTVDALARVLLTARRLGRDIRLRHASSALQQLLALAGLDDVMSAGRRPDCSEADEEADPPRSVQAPPPTRSGRVGMPPART